MTSPASGGSIVGRTYGLGALAASAANAVSTSSSASSAPTVSHTSANVAATPTTCAARAVARGRERGGGLDCPPPAQLAPL
jgi:hypothetical protein